MGAATGSGGRTPAAAATAPAPGGRRDRQPLRRLTVLYDPGCRLCSFVGGWLSRQRQLVPVDLVPIGSARARRRFPVLDHAATAGEITVVGDAGQVWRGDSAWIVCLWALADHRRFSHTLTGPAGRRLARAAVLGAAKYREAAGRRPAARPGARPADGRRYGLDDGWVYDPATGWSRAPASACADGCGPPG